MENVPGILSMKTPDGQKVPDAICKMFREAGYNVKYRKLNAANYGVPQKRIRVFFYAWLPDMEEPDFPAPTNYDPEKRCERCGVEHAALIHPCLFCGHDAQGGEMLVGTEMKDVCPMCFSIWGHNPDGTFLAAIETEECGEDDFVIL